MMQRKDGINSNSSKQPIGICHKLYNFIINTLFSPPLKRVTMGHTPNSDTDGEILLHDLSRKGEDQSDAISSSEIVVEFRHTEEDWTSKVDNLNAALLSDHVKQKENDQMARIGINMKPQVQGTSAEATSTNVVKGKGPKKTATIKHDQKDRDKQQQQQDNNIPTTVSSTVESDQSVRKPKLPRLLSVTSNINEKSDAFIESRLKAMRKNFTFETKQS